MTCNCARDTRRQRLTKPYSPSPGNKGACAIHFFCSPIFNGFFKEFIFHRFFAEQALEFFNLLHGGSKFRGRNDLFSGSHSSKTSLLVLLTPEK
ncbi:Uncharacterised protein [Klebsiella pneumoniae subsp. rhinoscleromatis]|nr:Uncharacterised protein [Klebsiella pneumoniae subsp. rhinoscleromatis]